MILKRYWLILPSVSWVICFLVSVWVLIPRRYSMYLTHAFFKALLFLCAGSVIHAMSGEQDIRNMGGLKKISACYPYYFSDGLYCHFRIPPFSGFFSKDEILTAAYGKNPVYFIIGVAGAMITAFYMFRLYATTFLGKFRGTENQEHHLHESPSSMTIPLVILAVLAVIGGFFGIPELFVRNSNFLAHFLSPVFAVVKEQCRNSGIC